MAVFICGMCGHIEFGKAPEKCPVCGSDQEKYTQNDRVFIESEEKSKEASVKHIPEVTINHECKLIPDLGCTDVIVRVGKVIHPMEPAHYIRFIDCYVDDVFVTRAMLSPGAFPGAIFHVKAKGAKVRVVENCTIHGYWQTEVPM